MLNNFNKQLLIRLRETIHKRDSARPRTGHGREYVLSGKENKTGTAGRKQKLRSLHFTWKVTWRKRSWSETGPCENFKLRWNKVWNEKKDGMSGRE